MSTEAISFDEGSSNRYNFREFETNDGLPRLELLTVANSDEVDSLEVVAVADCLAAVAPSLVSGPTAKPSQNHHCSLEAHYS